MVSSLKGQIAAEYARRAAENEFGPEWMELSSLGACGLDTMCWNAVLICLIKSGAVTTAQALAMRPNAQQWTNFIRTIDPTVSSVQEMRRVPQGAILGFINTGDNKLVHSMISVGAGLAAGNKNDCLGMGRPIGWEVLDLGGMNWQTTGGVLDVQQRNIQIRCRPI